MRAAILLPREKNAKQGLRSASIVAADCKWCESQTGLAEYGSEVISPGLEFKYSFQWEVFWAMVHTGKMPSGAVLDWVPDKCAAAFAVFHFSGMFGTSEAHAESVGSTLKYICEDSEHEPRCGVHNAAAAWLDGYWWGIRRCFIGNLLVPFLWQLASIQVQFLVPQHEEARPQVRRWLWLQDFGWLGKKNDHGVGWTQRDLNRLAQDLDLDTEPRVSRSLGWRNVLGQRRRSSMA